MNRIQNLHNKTQEVQEHELPYNSNNILIQQTDIKVFFENHGLTDMPIHNINLYRNAFVHRSYCTMKNDDFESGNERCPQGCIPLQEMSYERLEFIGDSILGMVCATYLYERYPDQAEGFLSKLRTKIVNGKMLGYLATKVGFPKFVMISKQVEDVHGRNNYKIMEDVFEAFIGAIYVDYNQVQYMQHTYQDAPRFFEVSVDMLHNQKVFTYCIKDKSGFTLGTAKGNSKKEAENLSAKEALKYYGQSPQ